VVADQQLQADLLNGHVCVRHLTLQPHLPEGVDVRCVPQVQAALLLSLRGGMVRLLHQDCQAKARQRPLQVGRKEELPRCPPRVQGCRCHLGLHGCRVGPDVNLPYAAHADRQGCHCSRRAASQVLHLILAQAAFSQHIGRDAPVDAAHELGRDRQELAVVRETGCQHLPRHLAPALQRQVMLRPMPHPQSDGREALRVELLGKRQRTLP
jgi:hypothetical protein